jgi:3-oxoacyl-[acyl-carrier protein] reductase
MGELTGKVALVTGSSGGVGAATVKQLAAKGCSVAINFSKSRAAGEAVAAECEKLGGQALLVQGNVADDADCRRIVAETLARFGRIDFLVNNAGTTKFVAHKNLGGLSAEDFHAIYAVNTIGPFQMVRAAEAALRAARGAVVNVSSVAGVYGTGSSLAYVASKAALNGMTLSLARVLGPEVRINAVCPGFIEGDWLREGMGDQAYETARATWKANAPLGTTNTPNDVADSILMFLLYATNVTGETLLIDSGMRLAQPRPPVTPR